MPTLSQRAHSFPSSPIRKLAAAAEGAKKRGIKVFHLNIGQPDIPTPPEFFAAIREANIQVLEYSPSAGFSELRQAIAEYYGNLNYPVTSEQVVVTTGASEAIQFAFLSMFNPGDEVIVPEPFYANYSAFALMVDAKLVPVASHLEDDFALPDIAAFRDKINDRTRAIMICNPGNPTGILYPRPALEQLKQLCLEHDLYLVADEVYREFVYDGLRHHSVLGLSELESHTVVVDSISKRFSACGARIGCLITRNDQLLATFHKLAQARLSPPTLGQIGAAAVYRLPSQYYQGVVDEYSRRRDVLKAALDQIEGVRCPEINGAFYAMVGLPIDSADDFCRWMLEEFQHQGQTVMMAPGPGFFADPSRGTNLVRLAYVLKKEDLQSAMQVLEAGLKAWARSGRELRC